MDRSYTKMNTTEYIDQEVEKRFLALKEQFEEQLVTENQKTDVMLTMLSEQIQELRAKTSAAIKGMGEAIISLNTMQNEQFNRLADLTRDSFTELFKIL